MILKDGLRVFHRAYTRQRIEKIDLTSGLIHAISLLSKEVGELSLQSIDMKTTRYHFKQKNNFNFVLREIRDKSLGKIQKRSILNSLAYQFFKLYPNANDIISNSKGYTQSFNDFGRICDKIIQVHPIRQGSPFLLTMLLDPLFLSPITKLVPISTENQDLYNELQFQLKNYAVQITKVGLRNQMQTPFILSLPECNSLVYIFPLLSKGINHYNRLNLLCMVTDENNWFTLYECLPLIEKRAQIIYPTLNRFLKELETDHTREELRQNIPKMQEILNNWSDLSQYVSIVNTSMLEEFYKIGMRRTRSILSEEQLEYHFSNLLRHVGEDFDKLIFALLVRKQIIFTGDKETVQQTLSSLLAFFPSPSVSLWTSKKREQLLVGTHPDNIHLYDPTESIVVDLQRNEVIGGTKNGYCSEIISTTKDFANHASINLTRLSFQAKITGLFALIKSLLEIFTIGKEEQQRYARSLLKIYPHDTLQLIIEMSHNINYALAENLKSIEARVR